jgi:hypothetical protein
MAIDILSIQEQEIVDGHPQMIGTPHWTACKHELQVWFLSQSLINIGRWNANLNNMKNSCQWNGWAENNSDQELADLQSAIRQVSSETGVDARYILAIIIQESKGCVRVKTTENGVRNPGLMQDHDGSATCNDNGVVRNPCPKDQITQMIRDGTAGTTQGDGLVQVLRQSNGNYYKAARRYNSGSIDSSGLLERGGSVHCYSSDIANRLTGWVDAHSTCNFVSSPPSTGGCSQSYIVQSGDTCDKVATQFGTTFKHLRELNQQLNADCTNLQLGVAYCVA